MYVIFVKENSKHTVTAIVENLEEVKSVISKQDMMDKINHGKAYLVEGDLRLIRPETTPELLEIQEVIPTKDSYY